MIYQYQCQQGHTSERFRKIDNRHDPVSCDICHEPMQLIISRTAKQPDGIYSYMPNVGNPRAFEQRHAAIRENKERRKDGLSPKSFPKFTGEE